MPIFRVRNGFTVAGRYVAGELVEMTDAEAATVAHMVEPVPIEVIDQGEQRVGRYQPPARNTVTVKGAA